jgi:hypothetical protein
MPRFGHARRSRHASPTKLGGNHELRNRIAPGTVRHLTRREVSMRARMIAAVMGALVVSAAAGCVETGQEAEDGDPEPIGTVTQKVFCTTPLPHSRSSAAVRVQALRGAREAGQ